jgi:7,8-dihydro-6-hydroxymethylpterin dimethyltransferase
MVQGPEDLGYQNICRVLIVQLLDAHAFGVHSREEDVHSPRASDGRPIPLDICHPLRRDEL